MLTHKKQVAVAVGAALCLVAPVLWSHHGSTGIYNFSRPYYVEGTVQEAFFGFPHAELILAEVPDALPEELVALTELERAEQRNTAELLAIVPDHPTMEISFDGRLTRALTAHSARPQVGDRIRAVVYRRDSRDRYMGEYRVMMLELPNGEQLILGKRAYFRELG